MVGCSTYQEVKKKLPFVFPNYLQCTVVKFIDGDKFHCQFPNVRIERVKMIGIQIPESLKERAGRFTRCELVRGSPDRLGPDQLTTDGVNLLAYVYLPGGQMLNSLLIEEGHAVWRGNSINSRYDSYFSKLENEAKEDGKGLWGEKSQKLIDELISQ